MKRWRKETLIVSVAYLIGGAMLPPVVNGNHLMWSTVMMIGGLFGLLTIITTNYRLGQIAATAMIAASILRASSFVIGFLFDTTILSTPNKISAAILWLLLAYEVGSVWIRVIIPGIRLEKMLNGRPGP